MLGLPGGVNLKFGGKASQQRLQGPALVCHAGIWLFANINLHYNIKLDHWRAVLTSWLWIIPRSVPGLDSLWTGQQPAPKLDPVLPSFLMVGVVYLCLCSLAGKNYSLASSLLSSVCSLC